MKNIIFEFLTEEITLIWGYKHRFFEGARKQLENVGYTVFKLQSEPSAAKRAFKHVQCSKIAIANKDGLLFSSCLRHKYKFWLFKNLLKSVS